MKKRIGIFLFILFTALALVCAGAAADEDDTASFGEFSGDGTVNAELAGFSGEPFVFFEKPLYARSTLPDGLTTFDAFDYVFLCPPGKRGDSEIPDAGEDIVTISKGKVKIAKTAPEGAVITVTCTAIGAPEPIVKTVQLTVAK